MNKRQTISCVIFDLGGVLVELDGPPLSPHKTQLTEAEIWQTWLQSEAVRKFESGAIDHHEFAESLLAEFQLQQPKDQLISQITQWPIGFFPEAESIIQALHGEVQLACLSNTNDLHWQRFKGESAIYDLMDEVFLSFQMGLLKPDADMFRAVQSRLGIPPEQLLFLDDNQLNVEAARQQGWQAVQTRGPAEVMHCLKQYELL